MERSGEWKAMLISQVSSEEEWRETEGKGKDRDD